jgi:Hint domain
MADQLTVRAVRSRQKPAGTVADRMKLVYADDAGEEGVIERLDAAGRIIGQVTMRAVVEALPSFTADCMIATAAGARRAGDLLPGTGVVTRDNGIVTLRGMGAVTAGWRALGLNPVLRPILIRAGALGPDCPDADMVVAPGHRMIVADGASPEGGIAARLLLGRPGIERMGTEGMGSTPVTYVQLVFAAPQVILVNGSWSVCDAKRAGGMAEILDGQGLTVAPLRMATARPRTTTIRRTAIGANPEPTEQPC